MLFPRHYIAILVFFSTFLSCGHQKNNDIAITGQWQVLEIRSVNGRTEKAPGLTVYHFYADKTYTFELDKNDSIQYSYKGSYSMKNNNTVLSTDYTLEGERVLEDAAILTLSGKELVIKDLSNNGDTILFRKYGPLKNK